MGKLLLASLAIGLAAGSALAGDSEQRVYDAQGLYQGRTATDAANPRQKNLYDANGHYEGRVMTAPDGSSRAYDPHGKYLGRTSGDRMPELKK